MSLMCYTMCLRIITGFSLYSRDAPPSLKMQNLSKLLLRLSTALLEAFFLLKLKLGVTCQYVKLRITCHHLKISITCQCLKLSIPMPMFEAEDHMPSLQDGHHMPMFELCITFLCMKLRITCQHLIPVNEIAYDCFKLGTHANTKCLKLHSTSQYLLLNVICQCLKLGITC